MPIYEALFDMQISLCNRFPALTPFSIRKEPAREVFLLISRYNHQNSKKVRNHKKVIRKPAGDDWF